METQKKKILLIEDHQLMGEGIIQIITEELHLECEWVVRLQKGQAEENFLLGYRMWSSGLEEVRVDLSQISVALVDGSLGRDEISGWEIVPDLVKAQITCVGISADHDAILVQKGCQRNVSKSGNEFSKFLRRDLPILHAERLLD